MRTISSATTPRQKIIISTSLTALVTVALLAFITWPSLQEIRRLNSEIDSQRTELEALYLRGQSLKQTLKTYTEVRPTVGALEHIYVRRGEELTFITSLEAAADSTQVEQAIKINAPAAATGEGAQPLPLQLDLRGSLDRFISYLAAVEALDYYVNIDTVRLGNPGRIQPGTRVLSALLLATTFVKP